MSARASIVGTGIAGLATSIALKRLGMSVRLYERAPEPRTAGGMLALWSNAMNALGSLGLGPDMLARGTPVSHVDFRDWRGKLLWKLELAPFTERYGAPSIFILRSDVLAVLLDHVDGTRIQFGAECTGFEESAAGVRPLLRAGAAPFGDLLIGADGLGSAIRAQLLGPERPRSAHHVGWVGIGALDEREWPFPEGVSEIVVARGLRFCTATLKGGPPGQRIVHWYVAEKVSTSLSPGDLIDRRRLLGLLHGCAVPIATLVERTPELLPFWISDRWPSRRWGQGRVTLLGDSAHPSTPDLGQGACQSLEGAVTLERWLAKEDDLERALRGYEQERMSRTAFVTQTSRIATIQSMISLPGFDLARNLGLRSVIPPVALKQFHAILGHRA